MRSSFTIWLIGVGLTAILMVRLAHAEDPTGGAPPPATDASADVAPPALKEHPEPAYPADALRDRVSGSVELELTVDATGHVVKSRVVRPAGHGFDEAALAAVETWTFDPAKQNGTPIQSTVQLTIPFEPPALPAPVTEAPPPAAAPPPPAPAASEPQLQQNAQSTLVLGRRPISAASSFAVRDRDFALRPIASVQDILRVTPGLVMVQHSGGGKANQYFLRGFDADHGTDLALSIDGIPINMVSHAHGQGFADTNFIIPETVERVEITKGPYFANQGDFATAGAVNLISRDGFEHSSLAFGAGGSPGHGSPSYRGLLIASPKWESAKAMFAAEVGRQDGPFDNPEGWDKYKLFNKVTFALTPTSSFTVGESSYAGNWHGSGQIPARAVDEGLISRFGSIDPNEGGNTARHQVFLTYKLRPTEETEITALAFVGTYRFNLFSNFTLYLNDPDNGDEIEQVDRRGFYGGNVSYRVVRDLSGLRLDTTIGGNVRSDDIHEELWHSRQRSRIDQIRGNDVHETFVGAYVNEEVTPARWLRLDVGGRADLLSFAVDNQLVTTDPTNPRSGIDAAHQFSPKASLVASPLDTDEAQLEVYVNWGHGFHSNDVRGVFATPSVTPLTRAVGEEVGARTRLWSRLDFAVAGWLLDLDNETTWNGDDGTTGVSDATRRYGIEFETRFEFTPWLAADGSLTFTKSQFAAADRENGGGLALAPKQTWSGGVSARHELGPGVARAGLRFYGIGDRPASDDGVLIAPGFTQFDLHLGYRHRWFDIAVDIENLFNGTFRSAQFDTVSRLPSEPAVGAPVPAGFACGTKGRLATNPGSGANDGRFWGCEDVDFTPSYPMTARVMATIFLD
jgi:TonB family protein